MADVALAAVEPGDLVGVDVEAEDGVAAPGERLGQRQADVAQADDGDARRARLDARRQVVGERHAELSQFQGHACLSVLRVFPSRKRERRICRHRVAHASGFGRIRLVVLTVPRVRQQLSAGLLLDGVQRFGCRPAVLGLAERSRRGVRGRVPPGGRGPGGTAASASGASAVAPSSRPGRGPCSAKGQVHQAARVEQVGPPADAADRLLIIASASACLAVRCASSQARLFSATTLFGSASQHLAVQLLGLGVAAARSYRSARCIAAPRPSGLALAIGLGDGSLEVASRCAGTARRSAACAQQGHADAADHLGPALVSPGPLALVEAPRGSASAGCSDATSDSTSSGLAPLRPAYVAQQLHGLVALVPWPPAAAPAAHRGEASFGPTSRLLLHLLQPRDPVVGLVDVRRSGGSGAARTGRGSCGVCAGVSGQVAQLVLRLGGRRPPAS